MKPHAVRAEIKSNSQHIFVFGRQVNSQVIGKRMAAPKVSETIPIRLVFSG
jgi:hypothetical protein